MRWLSLFILATISLSAGAQSPARGWYLGVNPLSMAEPQTSLGPAFERRLSNKIGIWAEASFMFYNAYLNVDRKKLRGLRLVLQPRLYTNQRRTFFITPEIRFKNFSYNTNGNFVNNGNADTLYGLNHRANQSLIGGAFVMGRQFILSRKNGFSLELTAGVGGRHRLVNRKKIPDGYEYLQPKRSFGLSPDFESDDIGGPYFPFGIRFMWRISD